MKRKNQIRKSVRKRWLFLLSIRCLATLFTVWQNKCLTVSEFTYESGKIFGAFDGVKIVQISDLHNQEFGTANSWLLERIARQHPDLIAVTGDLVDCHRTDVQTALRFIEGAAEIAPVYYVTGNHEQLIPEPERKKLQNGLQQSGAVMLSGHAHGGQFRAPFGNFGMIAPGQGFFPKYTAGRYDAGSTAMVLSRGLGNSVIPVRIFNQPEIVTVVMRKK